MTDPLEAPAGEPIGAGDAVFVAADGKVYRTNGAIALRDAGVALYGDNYKAALARLLNNVRPDTVDQWVKGTRPIPPFVWPLIAAEIASRREVLKDLEPRIAARVGSGS